MNKIAILEGYRGLPRKRRRSYGVPADVKALLTSIVAPGGPLVSPADAGLTRGEAADIYHPDAAIAMRNWKANRKAIIAAQNLTNPRPRHKIRADSRTDRINVDKYYKAGAASSLLTSKPRKGRRRTKAEINAAKYAKCIAQASRVCARKAKSKKDCPESKYIHCVRKSAGKKGRAYKASIKKCMGKGWNWKRKKRK